MRETTQRVMDLLALGEFRAPLKVTVTDLCLTQAAAGKHREKVTTVSVSQFLFP